MFNGGRIMNEKIERDCVTIDEFNQIAQFLRDHKKELEKAELNFDKAVKIIVYLLNNIEADHIGFVENCILDSIKENFRVNLRSHVVKDKDGKWKPIEG